MNGKCIRNKHTGNKGCIPRCGVGFGGTIAAGAEIDGAVSWDSDILIGKSQREPSERSNQTIPINTSGIGRIRRIQILYYTIA